jgi:hypothetical protein
LTRTILSAELASGPTSTTAFVPNTSEWKKYTIDLTPYKSYTNLRVRFELQSLRGNNIYIDEFKVDEPTSLGEQLKSEMNFTLFPNPSRGISKLSFANSKNQLFENDIYIIDNEQVKILNVDRRSSRIRVIRNQNGKVENIFISFQFVQSNK